MTGDLIETRVAGHRNLVLLACDPKAPIGARPRRRSEYEKIFQLTALLMLASGREHHLAQFLFAPSFLDHAASPCMQYAVVRALIDRSTRTDAYQPLRLIAMRRTFFASADFGTVMVSTPFLNAAETLSSSMSL